MHTRFAPSAPRADLMSLIAALLGVLLLAACAAPSAEQPAPTGAAGGATEPAAEGLAGTSWALSDLDGNPPVAEATLQFDAEGRLAGTTGCNQYSGGYSAEGDTLAVGELISTKMACTAAGVMEQETRFLGALGQAASYSIAGDTLTIEGASGARLVFTRA
jgi:heat shock protein HslJ